MPRLARQASGTGIYHVMMRGINHQNIFEEQEDYYQFLNTLDMMALSYEPDGTPSGRNYGIYGYHDTDNMEQGQCSGRIISRRLI